MQMITGRIAALAVGVPVALALIGATGYNFIALAGQGTIQVNTPVAAGQGGVTADISGGDVLLKQAPIAVAELTGTGHYSLFRPVLRVMHTATGTEVTYHCLSLSGDCDLHATLAVPLRTAVTLSTEGGDVTVPAFSGDLTVLSGGGDVNAGSVDGTVQVQTAGGDLTADWLAGSLNLQTGGGDLNVNTMKGTGMVTVRTAGGDVSVQALADPDADIESSGGDVTLTFTQVPKNVRITADGGDVTVILPAGSAAYDIRATPAGGDVSIGSSVRTDSRAQNMLTLDSGGGDITVSEAS
jgi:hypothetical protein